MFLYETHCHTKSVSACASLTAEELVEIERRELAPGEKVWISEIGGEISCEYVPLCKEINKSLNTLFFKSENICGRMSVSSRREGDKIRLLGRNCTKSIRKLFSEAHFKSSLRLPAGIMMPVGNW